MSHAEPAPIPSFLIRTQPKESPMPNTQAPAKAPRQKRQDTLRTRLTVDIPLDLSDPKAMENAISAINAMTKGLPASATVKQESVLSKV